MPIKTLRFGAVLLITAALALCHGARANVRIEASVDGGPLQALMTFTNDPTPAKGPGTGGVAWTGTTSKNNTSSSITTLPPIGNLTPVTYDLTKTPFSLTQIVWVTLNGAKQGMNFNTNTAVIATVPEPGTFTLALSAGFPPAPRWCLPPQTSPASVPRHTARQYRRGQDN